MKRSYCIIRVGKKGRKLSTVACFKTRGRAKVALARARSALKITKVGQ